MRLSFEEIRRVAFGALWMEEGADGIRFGKFTHRQEAAFAALNAGLGERALTTTGVRLDFHTSSKHLRFSAADGRKFEVLVDGLLCRQFDCELLRAEGRVAELELIPLCGNADETRVTIVFPSHRVGVLEYVELDDGATLVPHRFDCKMLFIGDSITQGWNSEYDSLSYAWRVSQFFNAESVIQGVGGSYFHESTFDTLPFAPDTVIVALGTNDFNHYKTMEDLRLHVSAHLRLLAAEYGEKLCVISPIWRDSADKVIGSFADVRAAIIEEIARLGLRHIDGLTLVPHSPAFMADLTLHPNDLGFSLYAQNLIAELQK